VSKLPPHSLYRGDIVSPTTREARLFRVIADSAPIWEPLEQLCRLASSHPNLPSIDADHFMYMGLLARPGEEVVHLYKHVSTRRYLYLDAAGHAYSARRVSAAWALLPERSLIEALVDLDRDEAGGTMHCEHLTDSGS
jgi:hypothetical protein